jgi:hypothetical protein
VFLLGFSAGPLFAKAPPATDATPDYLLKNTPPDSQTIENAPPTQLSDQLRSELPTEKTLSSLKGALKQLPPDSHVYFVGNGMEPAYQISQRMTRKTPLENHMHPLALSRQLIHTELAYVFNQSYSFGPTKDSPPQLQKKLIDYLNRQGVFSHASTAPIILVDSAIPSPSSLYGAPHSLLRLRDLAVAELVKRGMTKADAFKRVIPLVIPEAWGPEALAVPFARGFEDYAQHVGATPTGELTPGTPQFVYLPGLEPLHRIGISVVAPRWNAMMGNPRSKYSHYDAEGNPAAESTLLQQVPKESAIWWRKMYVEFYRELYATVDRFQAEQQQRLGGSSQQTCNRDYQKIAETQPTK